MRGDGGNAAARSRRFCLLTGTSNSMHSSSLGNISGGSGGAKNRDRSLCCMRFGNVFSFGIGSGDVSREGEYRLLRFCDRGSIERERFSRCSVRLSRRTKSSIAYLLQSTGPSNFAFIDRGSMDRC